MKIFDLKEKKDSIIHLQVITVYANDKKSNKMIKSEHELSICTLSLSMIILT